MKKLFTLTLITVITFSSCAPVAYKAFTYSIDYSSYSRDGFFVTEAKSVNFEYIPVASVGSEIESGYLTSKETGDNTYTKANPDDALAYLVVQAKKLGADAIIGLEIRKTSTGFEAPSYIANGMAVKRK